MSMGSHKECFSAWILFFFISFPLLIPPCCFFLGPDPNLECVPLFSCSPHQVLYHSPHHGHKSCQHPCACGPEHCAPHGARPCHALRSLGDNDGASAQPQLHPPHPLHRGHLSPGCHRIPPATTSRQTCCRCARDNFSCCICPLQLIQEHGSHSLAH